MLKNYLITALRRLRYNRSYAIVNVLGLALGMTCCLLIFLIIRHESGFDRFHRHFERIYRVVTDETINDKITHTSGSPIPFAAALRNDFPQIEKAAVSLYNQEGLFSLEREGQTLRFQENRGVVFVEPAFFEIFDFPWLAGDPNSLAEPNTVALTEDLAAKFFPGENPLGKTIRLDNQIDLKITGVAKNPPARSDFPFTAMISFKTAPQSGYDVESWGHLMSNVHTYLLLPPGESAQALESQFPAFTEKYFRDDVARRFYRLQTLSDLHFNPRYGNYGDRTISKTTLWALGLIGFLLLLAACINFINMATAQALQRAREVGVRKALGAFREQLVGQFLGETFLIVLFAALLSLALTEMLLPSLKTYLGLKIQVHPLQDLRLLGFTAALAAAVTLLAGLYPAFILSCFTPALALKNKPDSSPGGAFNLRRALVIFQFIICQMLILATIIVSWQLDYFRNKDLGFEQEAVVITPLPRNDAAVLSALRNELLRDSRIHNVSFSFSSAASGIRWDSNLQHTLNGAEEDFVSDLKFADASYLSVYGLKLVAGRNYAESDTISEWVVNETFARKLGLTPDEIVGKTFKLGGRSYLPVVGVVRDFNATSLHQEIRPCLLAARRQSYYEAGIKIDLHNVKEALRHVEACWNAAFPDFLYSYQFLDERVARFYQEEQKTAQLFRVFSGITIFIGCLGLLGLVSFMAARRTKEVGVRKVLGASVGNILLLFGKEFAALILIAFAVAAPAAYYVMNSWLQDFAYRIHVGAGVFALALGITVLIAALTVGYQALRAALANPVESLRYE